MYPKKEYIGIPQKQSIPMYLSFQTPQKYPKLIKNTRNSSKTPPNLSKKATRDATYLKLQANLRANHSEVDTRGSILRGRTSILAGNHSEGYQIRANHSKTHQIPTNQSEIHKKRKTKLQNTKTKTKNHNCKKTKISLLTTDCAEVNISIGQPIAQTLNSDVNFDVGE